MSCMQHIPSPKGSSSLGPLLRESQKDNSNNKYLLYFTQFSGQISPRGEVSLKRLFDVLFEKKLTSTSPFHDNNFKIWFVTICQSSYSISASLCFFVLDRSMFSRIKRSRAVTTETVVLYYIYRNFVAVVGSILDDLIPGMSVVSPTSRFAHIEVVSPTRSESLHQH